MDFGFSFLWKYSTPPPQFSCSLVSVSRNYKGNSVPVRGLAPHFRRLKWSVLGLPYLTWVWNLNLTHSVAMDGGAIFPSQCWGCHGWQLLLWSCDCIQYTCLCTWCRQQPDYQTFQKYWILTMCTGQCLQCLYLCICVLLFIFLSQQ